MVVGNKSIVMVSCSITSDIGQHANLKPCEVEVGSSLGFIGFRV